MIEMKRCAARAIGCNSPGRDDYLFVLVAGSRIGGKMQLPSVATLTSSPSRCSVPSAQCRIASVRSRRMPDAGKIHECRAGCAGEVVLS
jgi:hypothetical protein